jgi:hypothetical protein
MLRYRWLKILGIFATVVIAFIAIKAVYRATTFKPQSIFEVPFRERSHSKFDEDVRVTAAVLSAKESRQVFGVNLAGKGIQPVWVKIENHDTTPYWLLSSGLDPDYFSPLESAATTNLNFLHFLFRCRALRRIIRRLISKISILKKSLSILTTMN